MKTLVIYLAFFLLASLSQAIEVDYCVANYSLSMGTEGFACRDPRTLTTDDFIFTGFRGDKLTNNIFRNNITVAFLRQFPALNGLGLSMARLGGVIPVHAHRTSEIIVAVRGSVIAGFIDTKNTAYYRRLEIGDVMTFPQSMLHFQVNVGDTPAIAFVTLSAANPGVQFTTTALFTGNLPANVTEQMTLLSHEEVLRMRSLFGNA